MADRAYGNRAGVAHIVDGGADVVVRISPQLLPLLEEGGKAMDVLARLRSLQGHACAEWDVVFEANRKRYSARLCAVRKSALNTQRAQKKRSESAGAMDAKSNRKRSNWPATSWCSPHCRKPRTPPPGSLICIVADGRSSWLSNASKVCSH